MEMQNGKNVPEASHLGFVADLPCASIRLIVLQSSSKTDNW